MKKKVVWTTILCATGIVAIMSIFQISLKTPEEKLQKAFFCYSSGKIQKTVSILEEIKKKYPYRTFTIPQLTEIFPDT
ncbi:MAG: hypothetical protein P9M03_09665, partial [Candidatus Theseobacter exili]|nr:hypothetical protein [Candidatus Theseobacter exili]